MINQLAKLLKEKEWKYQILRNDFYQKEAIYFVILNEEIILFKHQKGIIKDYIELIEQW